jgi:hypothetical protein
MVKRYYALEVMVKPRPTIMPVIVGSGRFVFRGCHPNRFAAASPSTR